MEPDQCKSFKRLLAAYDEADEHDVVCNEYIKNTQNPPCCLSCGYYEYKHILKRLLYGNKTSETL